MTQGEIEIEMEQESEARLWEGWVGWQRKWRSCWAFLESDVVLVVQTPQFSVSNARTKELDDAFFKTVYVDYEPLTKGECEGMRNFVSVAQPGYTTPCYSTVRDTLMPNALSEMEGRLRELLQLGDGFALTLDIWTNRRGHSFLGVVASFIDEMFNSHTVLLSCEHLKGHHTAENIFHKYESILHHRNLQRRVVRVVTDSASNMVKAFDLPGFDESSEEEGEEEVLEEDGNGTEEVPLSPFQPDFAQIIENMSATYITESNLHMRCPIHLLQLAIKDAINGHADVDKMITRTAKLVKSIRKSTLNTEEADKLGVRPTPACVTRWSSQLRMIESVLKMFERDPQFQNKLKIPEHSKLTMNDVLHLQALTEVLLPLAKLTTAMQKELGNLGMILPAVMEIKQLLSSVPDNRSVNIRAFVETLSDNVSTRFNRFYSDKHLVLAAVLDPRFKTEWIIRDGTVSNQLVEIREMLVKEAECSGVETAGTQ
ncbi:unnamed protein product [Leuciscus chuanchicus]